MAFLVRQQSPAWKADAVVDGEFVTLSKESFLGSWLVLFFYPLDHTFVCPTEITAFSDRVGEFTALGAKVVGASIDSKFSHLAWINTPRTKGGLGAMKIPILADVTKAVSRSFGVLIEDVTDGDCGVALRGTFIIDPSGKVRCAMVNDLPVGRSVDETLRLLQAFQFTDAHGEVCPLGWTPGAKTMVADPTKSQAYFASVFGGAGKSS